VLMVWEVPGGLALQCCTRFYRTATGSCSTGAGQALRDTPADPMWLAVHSSLSLLALHDKSSLCAAALYLVPYNHRRVW
jgi:hypothetical protein